MGRWPLNSWHDNGDCVVRQLCRCALRCSLGFWTDPGCYVVFTETGCGLFPAVPSMTLAVLSLTRTDRDGDCGGS